MDQTERHAHSDRPRCVVVYESMFGNTEEIASAVADGLSARFDVEVCNVNDAASRPGPHRPARRRGTDARLRDEPARHPLHSRTAAGAAGRRPRHRCSRVARRPTAGGSGDDGGRIRHTDQVGPRLGRPGDATTAAAPRIPHADQGDEVLGGRNPRTFTCWGARSRTSLGRQPRRRQPERGEHPPVACRS